MKTWPMIFSCVLNYVRVIIIVNDESMLVFIPACSATQMEILKCWNRDMLIITQIALSKEETMERCSQRIIITMWKLQKKI